MDAKDGQLRGLEVFRSEDKKAMDKILTAVGLDKSQLNEGVSIEEIANKIGAYTAESASVVSDTHSAQQEHYMGVSEVEQTVFAETTYANTGDINAIMFGVSREVLQDHTTVAVLEEII